MLAPAEAAPISAAALVGSLEILVPMAGLIDPKAELDRLAKRRRRAETEFGKLQVKLANGDFARNAPPDVVAKDRARLSELRRRDRPAGEASRAGQRAAGPMSRRARIAVQPAVPEPQSARCSRSINRVILGKDAQIRLCLACLLARGHLLIEDIPGVGKTTLAHALAKTLGLSFQRVQFTSDLLPADVLGVSIYDRETGKFRFQQGPIFAQLVLADEINRASPKAQSALLEAMEERQVTLDGQSHAAAGAVLRHRHAKSAGTGRHVPAARIPARPVPDARASGLSGSRRRARTAERHGSARTGAIRSAAC